MAITVTCSNCGAAHNVAETMAGSQIQCACGILMAVPSAGQPTTSVPMRQLSEADVVMGAMPPQGFQPYAAPSTAVNPQPVGPTNNPYTMSPGGHGMAKPEYQPPIPAKQKRDAIFGIVASGLSMLFCFFAMIIHVTHVLQYASPAIFRFLLPQFHIGTEVILALSSVSLFGFSICVFILCVGVLTREPKNLDWAENAAVIASSVYVAGCLMDMILSWAVAAGWAGDLPTPLPFFRMTFTDAVFTAVFMAAVPITMIVYYFVRRTGS